MGSLHHSLSRKVIYNKKALLKNFLSGVFSLIVMKLYIMKKVIISMSIDFSLDSKLASKYKSNAQKIRVMSESWVGKNLFCPSCGNPHLSNLPNNMSDGSRCNAFLYLFCFIFNPKVIFIFLCGESIHK